MESYCGWLFQYIEKVLALQVSQLGRIWFAFASSVLEKSFVDVELVDHEIASCWQLLVDNLVHSVLVIVSL